MSANMPAGQEAFGIIRLAQQFDLPPAAWHVAQGLLLIAAAQLDNLPCGEPFISQADQRTPVSALDISAIDPSAPLELHLPLTGITDGSKSIQIGGRSPAVQPRRRLWNFGNKTTGTPTIVGTSSNAPEALWLAKRLSTVTLSPANNEQIIDGLDNRKEAVLIGRAIVVCAGSLRSVLREFQPDPYAVGL
jgi:hypothetical protein